MFLKKFYCEKKAQVSFEYLLTVVFAILLVIAVTIFALNLRNLVVVSERKIMEIKKEFFNNVFG